MRICDICHAVATDKITFEVEQDMFDVCETCKQKLKGLLVESKKTVSK